MSNGKRVAEPIAEVRHGNKTVNDPHGYIAGTKLFFKLSLIVALVVVAFALGWRLGQ